MIIMESVNESVINVPENTTMYFIQSKPFQSKKRPPNVSITDKNGSIIKNNLIFLLSFVMLNNNPNKKKIMDIDKI